MKFIKILYLVVVVTIIFSTLIVLKHSFFTENKTTQECIQEDASDSKEAIRERISNLKILQSQSDSESKAETNSEYENLNFTYYGSFGSLIIPNADISVGLEWIAEYYDDKTAQGYVDEENMAGWMPMGDAVLIADHVSQEFGKLYDCEIGDIAYVDSNNQITAYECYRIEYGTNEGKYIADKNGYDITRDDVYVMYTCTDNSYNILLTFWEPIKDTGI